MKNDETTLSNKNQIADAICKRIVTLGLSRAEAVKVLSTEQARVSNLFNNHLEDISFDRLVNFAHRLGLVMVFTTDDTYKTPGSAQTTYMERKAYDMGRKAKLSRYSELDCPFEATSSPGRKPGALHRWWVCGFESVKSLKSDRETSGQPEI